MMIYGKDLRMYKFLSLLNEYRLACLYKDPCSTRRLRRLLDAANDPDFLRDRMMTVRDFSEMYGINIQTVYAALNRSEGVLVKKIASERRGDRWHLAMLATPDMFDSESEANL